MNKSRTTLRRYVRENYVLGRKYTGEVYNGINLRHLRNTREIDKYIDDRFNIAKLKKVI